MLVLGIYRPSISSKVLDQHFHHDKVIMKNLNIDLMPGAFLPHFLLYSDLLRTHDLKEKVVGSTRIAYRSVKGGGTTSTSTNIDVICEPSHSYGELPAEAPLSLIIVFAPLSLNMDAKLQHTILSFMLLTQKKWEKSIANMAPTGNKKLWETLGRLINKNLSNQMMLFIWIPSIKVTFNRVSMVKQLRPSTPAHGNAKNRFKVWSGMQWERQRHLLSR